MNTNRFYSAYNVLHWFITSVQEQTVVNYTVRQRYTHCTMWVADNDANITHYNCDKLSPTEFVIRWYGGEADNYAQLGSTAYDFTDINTPPLEISVSQA